MPVKDTQQHKKETNNTTCNRGPDANMPRVYLAPNQIHTLPATFCLSGNKTGYCGNVEGDRCLGTPDICWNSPKGNFQWTGVFFYLRENEG